MSLGVLVIIGVIVAAVAGGRSSRPGPGAPSVGPAPTVGVEDDDLAGQLDGWVDAGLITVEQARGIIDHERAVEAQPSATPAVPAARRRVPLVAEALGYLGGILGIVGLVLLIARYWPDLADGIRLGIAVAGGVAAVVAGAMVPVGGEMALLRLRWFLWLAGTAAAGVAGGVIAHDLLGFDSSREEVNVALGVALAVAVVSAGLWRGREAPVQQATMMLGSAVALGTFVDDMSHQGWSGLAVWALGIGFVIMGIATGLATSSLWVIGGGITSIIGAAMSSDRWMGEGLLLALASALGCVVLGTVLARPGEHPVQHRALADRLRGAGPTGLVVVGAIGLLQIVPMTVGHFADRAGVATGAVLWVTGVVAQVIAERVRIRLPLVVAIIGGAALVVGPAVMGIQSESTATLFGLATAIVAVALGSLPGRVLLSLIGSVGLLVFVPWSIAHFFPGEGRAPLLIAASGGVIVLVAVLMARSGSRLRSELGRESGRR